MPLPWDRDHVAYVWFDALTNYLAAVGFGTDAERFAEWWPVDYHLIGKDIIRHHCVYWPAMLMSAGVELPKGWAVGGWLLSGGEKMSKTTGNVVKPLDLVDTVGVDGFRYYVLADTAVRPGRRLHVRGPRRPLQRRPRQQPRQPRCRVATVVTSKCGGIGAGPVAGQPAGGRRGRRGRRGDRGVGRRPTEPGARGDVAARAGDERPPRGERAVEDGARPGVDAVLGDALEALRIVAILASPAIPGTAQAIWERIGMPGAVTDQRVPDAVAWGGYPGGLPVTKGPSLFPRITT